MTVKCINAVNIDLTLNKLYEVITTETINDRIFYRIKDDSDDDYLYERTCFEIIK